MREWPEFADVTCLAIACPSCMTLELARSCASYVTTIINGADLIPTVSAGRTATLFFPLPPVSAIRHDTNCMSAAYVNFTVPAYNTGCTILQRLQRIMLSSAAAMGACLLHTRADFASLAALCSQPLYSVHKCS